MGKAKKMDFDGPCPFLTCFETLPHSHPVCPVCGAVRYGNINCSECKKHSKQKWTEILKHLAAHGVKVNWPQ
jgi:hypothetical protein